MALVTLTLHDILELVEDGDYSLSEDATIQIIDYETGAHFRRDLENHTILLGGNYCCMFFKELFDLPVECMEVIDNTLTIYVRT